MNKIVIGLLLGALLGAIDGGTAWFTPAVRAQIVTIVIGSTFKGLATAKAPGPKSSAKALSNLAKSYGGITASTNICQDSAAFAGPDSPLPGG